MQVHFVRASQMPLAHWNRETRKMSQNLFSEAQNGTSKIAGNC